MKINSKNWIKIYFGLTFILLFAVLAVVIYVDPAFHYHKPNPKYFYKISNERVQNDGIVKHFDYQGVITGTSMTENFKTSEANMIFDCEFVKVPFSGATYNEVNNIVETALANNPECRIIIRGLDYGKIVEDKDKQRFDLGVYPTYLYDNNIFNDVNYVLNRNTLFGEVYPMIVQSKRDGFSGGYTSFDIYSNWMNGNKFGVSAVYSKGQDLISSGNSKHLSNTERTMVQENIIQNVTNVADKYPNVVFYYFFTPYSVVYWETIKSDGTIYKQIEAEQIAIEEILKHKNIKLFSFNDRYDITTDLNNYKDSMHYGEWINSLMLRDMFDEKSILNEDNYKRYIENELMYYTEYNYKSLLDQEDYIDDNQAAQILAEQSFTWAQEHNLIGEGVKLDLSDSKMKLSSSVILFDKEKDEYYISCMGKLERDQYTDTDLAKYLMKKNYIGAKILIEDFDYKYITFLGRKVNNHGQPTVYVYNDKGELLRQCIAEYNGLNEDWQKYYLDVSGLSGDITIVFNGGYTDRTGSPDSQYEFCNIRLY